MLVEVGHTGSGPVMEHEGSGLMVTILLQVVLAWLVETVAVNVNDPDAPAVTETDEPVVDPLIVPLPLIDQLKVGLTALVVSVQVFVEPPQTGSGPTMPQVGGTITAAADSERSWLPPEPSRSITRVW